MSAFTWKTAAKIAWRESRASAVKFAFVVLAVAVGVASLTGVRGFATAFERMLLKEARTLMAADLTARIFSLPTPEQESVIDRLVQQGVRETQITETLTMVGSARAAAPVLVSVKAVDPAVYPFYGQIEFRPPGPIDRVLREDTVALGEDLMFRLNVAVGDSVRLGGKDYRVAAAVVTEPDRMAGSLNIGLRLMMSRTALERAGLIAPGSRAPQRFLFQLSSRSPGVEQVRQTLKNAFPEALIIDFRETHPIITRGLNRSTLFLSLVSLIALIVGALGVAMAMHSHLQQKLDSIAVMKCLGARSAQILRIYVWQTLALGLAGGLLGIVLGAGVQLAFPTLISKYFHLPPAFELDGASMLQGLLAGLLTTLLFTLPTLLSIRKIRPSLIFRRDMTDARRGWWQRMMANRATLAAAGVILLGMGLLAAWLSGLKRGDAARLGAYFVFGIVISLSLLAAVAAGLLTLLRHTLRRPGLGLPATLRHGLANLYRPGNQAAAVLVTLGLGVMFTMTVFLVQRSIVREIAANAPPGMANVFLIDIQAAQREAVEQLIAAQPGVEGKPEIVASVAARLTQVNRTPVEKLELTGVGRRFRQTRTVTWSDRVPASTVLISGKWWAGSAPGAVSVAEDAAKALRVQVGDELEFVASGQTLTAQVAAIHRTEAVRPGAAAEFIFSSETLRNLPATYFGGVRVQPAAVAALQRILYERFPTVTVINVADVIATIQDVVDQIALVIRFISGFAILAGIIILASSVAGTRFRRIREVVILKTLGATRRRISRIFSAEFLILGATAGFMGGLLASGFTNAVLIRFFEGDFRWDAEPILVATILTALLANTAGWLASARILTQKPLEVLRGE